MNTLKSIFKIYGIEEALVKNGDKLEIVIVKRTQNITLNRWINLVNSIKYSYKKEVNFLLEKDAKKIYDSFKDFLLIKEI